MFITSTHNLICRYSLKIQTYYWKGNIVFDRTKPYNNLPLLPPGIDIESKLILKRCITARSSLAELKQAGELIPNQVVLINTIPLLEAQISSEIENIVTTSDKLFQYASLDDDKADPATKETLQYRQALYRGYVAIKQKPVCTSTAVEICGTIRGTNIDIRKMPGTALVNPQSQEIIYTPPEGESVIRDKMFNWEKFVNERTEIESLVRMAMMHYQFEAIHPFSDGNGRTGRILNILFLIQEGLLDIPILYLSRFFIEDKSRYYTLLQAVTEQQKWEDWILYILEAVDETARWTREKIKAIQDLFTHTCEYVRQELPKIYTRELVEIIFKQPYCRIANLVQDKIAKRQSASGYLKKLVEIGILKEIKVGRENLYVHPKFLSLLTQNDHAFIRYDD